MGSVAPFAHAARILLLVEDAECNRAVTRHRVHAGVETDILEHAVSGSAPTVAALGVSAVEAVQTTVIVIGDVVSDCHIPNTKSAAIVCDLGVGSQRALEEACGHTTRKQTIVVDALLPDLGGDNLCHSYSLL